MFDRSSGLATCALIFVVCFSGEIRSQVAVDRLVLDVEATRLNPVEGAPIYRQALHNLTFDATGQRLAAGQGTGRVFIWDLETLEITQQFQAHDNWAFSTKFFNDGKRLVTGGGDDLVKIWDLSDLEQPQQIFAHHTEDVHSVVLSNDDRFLVTAGDDKIPFIQTLDDDDQHPSLRKLAEHPRQIPAMDLSSNGRLLATASRDGKLRVFNMSSGAEIAVLDAHETDCITLRFIPKTLNLVSGGYDGTVTIWNANMGYLVNRFPKHQRAVVCVDVSPDGQTVVSVDQSGLALHVLDQPQLAPQFLNLELVSDEQLSFVRYHPDGKQLFVATTLARIFIIDCEKLEVTHQLQAPGINSQPQRHSDDD